MATTVLKLTAEDVRKKLNPLQEPGLFMGEDSAVESADVDDTLALKEDYVLSRLPEMYRRLMRHIDGEILTKYATQNQSDFTLGLVPASNLKLYKSYPHGLPWSGRNHSHILSPVDYTADLTTGAVTLSPALYEGETLYAEYDHGAGASLRLVREMVLNLVCAEWARRLPYVSTDEFEQYREWEQQAYSDLKRMMSMDDGRLGIDVFDQLQLVRETRSASRIGTSAATGGW